MKLHELTTDPEVVFVADPEAVAAIKDHFVDFFFYDAFFVIRNGADYEAVWGMYGTQPTPETDVHMLVP